jgi:hypothetical protein
MSGLTRVKEGGDKLSPEEYIGSKIGRTEVQRPYKRLIVNRQKVRIAQRTYFALSCAKYKFLDHKKESRLRTGSEVTSILGDVAGECCKSRDARSIVAMAAPLPSK